MLLGAKLNAKNISTRANRVVIAVTVALEERGILVVLNRSPSEIQTSSNPEMGWLLQAGTVVAVAGRKSRGENAASQSRANKREAAV